MARRSKRREQRGQRGRRKSDAEARVERLTWALLVVAFAIVQITQQSGLSTLPNWFLPGSGAFILLGSGVAQYTRRWRVSPLTWIGGTVLLFFALVNLYINPAISFFGLSLLVIVLIIVFGLVTDET